MTEGHSILPPVGARIRAALTDLGRLPGVRVETEATGTAVRYDVKAAAYRMRLVVDPEACVGMKIVLPDEHGGELLSAWLDTDNYPIGLERHRWYAREVEDEIVEVVEALLHGRVHVGEVKGRPVMLVPTADGVRSVAGGPMWILGGEFAGLEDAMAEGVGWRPLPR